MPYSKRNHMFKDKYFKLDASKPSKTITSHMKFDCNMYIHPTQSRGLSPREAARIQTFPDDYVFMGANNSWYAQIGNAVPVRLAETIANDIMKRLRNE
jgi:DNA (cytosine-5)-methyltransferase 1